MRETYSERIRPTHNPRQTLDPRGRARLSSAAGELRGLFPCSVILFSLIWARTFFVKHRSKLNERQVISPESPTPGRSRHTSSCTCMCAFSYLPTPLRHMIDIYQLRISSAIDEARLDNSARSHMRTMPSTMFTLYGTRSRRPNDTDYSGSPRIWRTTPEARRSWIPWQLDSQLLDIISLASPIITSRIMLYNLHDHVRHVSRLWLGCQQRPRYAKQIWPWNVALGHLIVRCLSVCPRY